MNSIKVIGIDLAKSVFQVCVWMSDGSISFNRKVSRIKLLEPFVSFLPVRLLQWRLVLLRITGDALFSQWAFSSDSSPPNT